MLRIGTTGTQTPFLPEGELPSCARLAFEQEEGGQVQQFEDQELAEALAKSAQESASASTSHSEGEAATHTSTTTEKLPSFPEATIVQITRMGFTREQAIQGLTKANGDVNNALSFLFAQSLSSVMSSNR